MKYDVFIRLTSSILFIMSFNLSQACASQPVHQDRSSGQNLVYLPLDGEIANRYSEISGLTWYNDQLILLPQYPGRFMIDHVSSLFKISKNEIIKYINDKNLDLKLTPKNIEFDEQGIPDQLIGFQGYESVVIIDNKMYLTMECKQNGLMKAYLIEGTIRGNMEKIVLNQESLRLLPMPVEIKNYSYESMLIADDKLIIIYEANGSNIAVKPMLAEVNLKSLDITLKPFLNLEYRITDATSMDENGYFWVINYFWPGDYNILNPATDQLQDQMNPKITYSPESSIERLVELRYSSTGIAFSRRAPIVLGNTSSGSSRNWEGLTRLDNLGFLLATDKHPKTILAFLSND